MNILVLIVFVNVLLLGALTHAFIIRDLETSRVKTRPVGQDLPFKFVLQFCTLFQVNIIFKNI